MNNEINVDQKVLLVGPPGIAKTANQDNLINVVFYKNKQVLQRYKNLDKRTKPRIPYKLKWLAVDDALATKISNNIHLDKLARIFCLLEEFEGWLEKAEKGVKKHQEEMERQSSTKICRLKTFAALSCNFERDKKEKRFPNCQFPPF